MVGITNLLPLNIITGISKINRKLLVYSISAVILYSSFLFEQHNEEIIFVDSTNNIELNNYTGNAIGGDFVYNYKIHDSLIFSKFRKAIIIFFLLLLI